MVEIRRVQSKREQKEFVEFPLRLYRKHPCFVPPLYADEKKLLASGGQTAVADAVFFLALRDGQTVGRIQGIIEKQYNALHDCRQVRFTRFDAIEDPEVSRALFAAVEDWGRERGMTELCGPLGYNDLEREGMLVEGFDENSTFEEQYNAAYYGALAEDAGLCKDADWLEFVLSMPTVRNPMLHRVAQRALELHGLHIADSHLSKKRYIRRYRDGFFACLEECYRSLYGTVPLTREAQDALIGQFMLIVNKRYLILICDADERVVGFGLCFPGIGDAVKASGGRMTLPTLMRILRTVRHPQTLDLGLVAVLPEYQNAGLNAVILDALLDILEQGHVKQCQTNLNLETNTAVLAQWKYFDARQNKRRRSYRKPIANTKGEETHA